MTRPLNQVECRTLSLRATIYTPDQLVLPEGPQIALAGRSNVGKSSLVNRLGGSKGLAKVSQTPGKTRSINVYRVAPQGYHLVDLPGYGYARCSKKERDKWARLIEGYLTRAAAAGGGLAAMAVLVDSRLPPQQLDLEMVAYLTQASITLIPVLTKADKCTQAEQASRSREWTDILRGAGRPVLFSAKTGQGVSRLWKAFDAACGFEEAVPLEADAR